MLRVRSLLRPLHSLNVGNTPTLFSSARSFSTHGSAKVDNPYTGDIYCDVPYVGSEEAKALVERSSAAQKKWSQTDLKTRIALLEKVCDVMVKNAPNIGKDVSGMMGKPLKNAEGEVIGSVDRARGVMALAEQALATEILPPKDGFMRKIVKEPVGVVAVVAPWNYPLLTSVNAIFPSILAGNSVILKHSSRTPLVADHFEQAFKEAGAPADLLMALHAGHGVTAEVITHPAVGYAHFTGSVSGGRQVNQSMAAGSFRQIGLELGGKDPAYVREDADLDFTVANIVDGGLFNAGQSCCGIERVYVHESLYDEFLERASKIMAEYKLGDPSDPTTTMGPLATASSVTFLEQQVAEAKQKGAKVLLGGKAKTNLKGDKRFFEPTLVANCNHTMGVMTEESFGPILGVQAVKSDAEAVELMNDSEYGLTASIWSKDVKAAEALAPQIETGTVFLNRCDYLDPELPWTGVKDTGKGVSLSTHGYAAVTRLKGYHFKLDHA